MLKSLLMDRTKRKRSGSRDTTDTSATKKPTNENASKQSTKPGESSKPIPIPEAPKDILRKRLLGWVDPPANERPASRSRETPPANQEPVFPLDLELGQGSDQNKVGKKDVVTYANTSVLKHLLHRYTDSNGC